MKATGLRVVHDEDIRRVYSFVCAMQILLRHVERFFWTTCFKHEDANAKDNADRSDEQVVCIASLRAEVCRQNPFKAVQEESMHVSSRMVGIQAWAFGVLRNCPYALQTLLCEFAFHKRRELFHLPGKMHHPFQDKISLFYLYAPPLSPSPL